MKTQVSSCFNPCFNRRVALAAMAVSALSLSACTSTLVKPSEERLAQVPTVEVGSPKPQGEFILKIPAGKNIPIQISFKGTALSKAVDQTLYTQVDEDIYVFKDWVSRDGHEWVRADQAFNARGQMLLPSGDRSEGALVEMVVDRKVK